MYKIHQITNLDKEQSFVSGKLFERYSPLDGNPNGEYLFFTKEGDEKASTLDKKIVYLCRLQLFLKGDASLNNPINLQVKLGGDFFQAQLLKEFYNLTITKKPIILEFIFMPFLDSFDKICFFGQDSKGNSINFNTQINVGIDMFEIKDLFQGIRVTRMGIQGTPNLLFAINGSEMRLDQSGQFELARKEREDFFFETVGIVYDSTRANNQYFILTYEEGIGENE